MRPAGRWVGVEAQSLQRVVEKRLANRDRGPSAAHSVIERDDLLLRLRQIRMRSDLQSDMLVPVGIPFSADLARLGVTGLDDPREKEVLEALVGETEGPCMPAETVEPDRVWRNPAPARLRPGQGLVFDLDGL